MSSSPNPSSSPLLTHTLGYPRIGRRRQLKRAVEDYWKGALDGAGLRAIARDLRRRHWESQRDAGIDLPASNDFSLYDQVLDHSCLFGNVATRFGSRPVGEAVELDTYFAIARGPSRQACGCGEVHEHGDSGQIPGKMTKWFDTNYHYIMPELNESTTFQLSATKPFDEYAEAQALGIDTKPVLLGPVTYLYLGRVADSKQPNFDRFSLLHRLLPTYVQILQRLKAQGATWVQLDEPIFALDSHRVPQRALIEAYDVLSQAAPGLKLLVTTYFAKLGQNLLSFGRLPVQGLHVDLTRGDVAEVPRLCEALRKDTILSLGVVDGRNIWRTRFHDILPTIRETAGALGAERVWLAPSCSLLHVPYSAADEESLPKDVRPWLAFAEEKLGELKALSTLAAQEVDSPALEENRAIAAARAAHPALCRGEVRQRLAELPDTATQRASLRPARQEAQQARLQLPPFPTTTIGSFPQTQEIRQWRNRWRKGEIAPQDYEATLESAMVECLKEQEAAGLDVLVHGEFERTDMVEYFGEKLEGFAFTTYGWVQSYGSRCVKPPIIFGDVSRPSPMTVDWYLRAQRHSLKPVKGMLTGPITILNWSFVRNDMPRSEVCRQIGLAIRDEVIDLEKAGCAVIQIDEAALREGLPPRDADRVNYLKWSIDAFRLASAGVRDDTQIHTHMCYSDFTDILEAINAMDADVITIENSRAAAELLQSFAHYDYQGHIGPGVYDIHSPRVPTIGEMVALMEKAAQVFPPSQLWVNPDCGLKTRDWKEVRPSLANLSEAARLIRLSHKPKTPMSPAESTNILV